MDNAHSRLIIAILLSCILAGCLSDSPNLFSCPDGRQVTSLTLCVTPTPKAYATATPFAPTIPPRPSSPTSLPSATPRITLTPTATPAPACVEGTIQSQFCEGFILHKSVCTNGHYANVDVANSPQCMPAATQTPTPTATPIPSISPSPTLTPTMTPLPTPTPVPIPVSYYAQGMYIDDGVTLSNGMTVTVIAVPTQFQSDASVMVEMRNSTHTFTTDIYQGIPWSVMIMGTNVSYVNKTFNSPYGIYTVTLGFSHSIISRYPATTPTPTPTPAASYDNLNFGIRQNVNVITNTTAGWTGTFVDVLSNQVSAFIVPGSGVNKITISLQTAHGYGGAGDAPAGTVFYTSNGRDFPQPLNGNVQTPAAGTASYFPTTAHSYTIAVASNGTWGSYVWMQEPAGKIIAMYFDPEQGSGGQFADNKGASISSIIYTTQALGYGQTTMKNVLPANKAPYYITDSGIIFRAIGTTQAAFDVPNG